MNYLRGTDGVCFNDDSGYNFWFVFTLILISYLIYIFNEKKYLKIM